MSKNFLIRVCLVEWILGMMGKKKKFWGDNFLESVWVGEKGKMMVEPECFLSGCFFYFLEMMPLFFFFFFLTRHDFVFWTWFCQTFANFAKKSSKIVFKTRSPKNNLIVKAGIWSHLGKKNSIIYCSYFRNPYF